MSHKPTSEEIEKAILNIFSQLKIRPDESLPVKSLLNLWLNTSFKNDELASGLETLIAKGYLEDTGNQSFRLTKKCLFGKVNHPAFDVQGDWVGNIGGTNNGDVFFEMKQSAEQLSGKARLKIERLEFQFIALQGNWKTTTFFLSYYRQMMKKVSLPFRRFHQDL